MCLAIPGRITKIDEARMADVDILGVGRHVSLDLVPEAEVGDYVMVHAGYGIQIVDEEFAKETLELIRDLDIPELEGLPDGPTASLPGDEEVSA
jgi:hydrogenase expression/formation protein HypC